MVYMLLLPGTIHAQEKQLSLQKAQELARLHYPVTRQQHLLQQTTDLTIKNLEKAFLPQASVSGQATYQSEVTQVKIPLPGFSVDPLNKDQYKVIADVNQLLYDGGITTQQRKAQLLSNEVEKQKLEVELYKVKERINQLYLGILFLDEQLLQADLIKADLNTGVKRVEAQVNNGIAFKSNLNTLKAEVLKADQRITELTASRKGLLDVLGLFTHQQLSEKTILEKPVIAIALADSIQRPEIQLLTSQENLLLQQYNLISAKNAPRANVFVQGGYGRPGLNFLNNNFAFFYITGLRVNWNIGNLYTKKNDNKLVALNQQQVALQKETFLLNTRAALQQQAAEISKFTALVQTDAAIIELRKSVKDAAKAQLENGVITANDYLREVNAEDQARQSRITHSIQLLQAQINYQTTAGK